MVYAQGIACREQTIVIFIVPVENNIECTKYNILTEIIKNIVFSVFSCVNKVIHMVFKPIYLNIKNAKILRYVYFSDDLSLSSPKKDTLQGTTFNLKTINNYYINKSSGR